MSEQLDHDSRARLQQHLMRGVSRRRNYAPDTTYEGMKANTFGPHTVVIGDIFERWRALWVADAHALAASGMDGDLTPEQEWTRVMHEADAEVDRYLDANKLPRYA